jgi:hypothetical protein
MVRNVPEGRVSGLNISTPVMGWPSIISISGPDLFPGMDKIPIGAGIFPKS